MLIFQTVDVSFNMFDENKLKAGNKRHNKKIKDVKNVIKFRMLS